TPTSCSAPPSPARRASRNDPPRPPHRGPPPPRGRAALHPEPAGRPRLRLRPLPVLAPRGPRPGDLPRPLALPGRDGDVHHPGESRLTREGRPMASAVKQFDIYA